MRADRLLSMLWLLMAHESLSAAELARRLEVSARTVLRDVEALSASGVPVYCERGRAGGVRLLPGFRTRVTGLSEAEVRSVFLAMAAPVADSLNWGPAMVSGLRKLDAALPLDQRGAIDGLARRLVIDPEGWLPRHGTPPLEPLLEAALGDRRLRVDYRSRSAGGTWSEPVDAYGLLSAAGSWYLAVGRAGAPRFLRVERIERCEVLDQTFTRPLGLDLRALWESERAAYRRQHDEPVHALVELDPARRDDLAEAAAGVTDRGVAADGRLVVLATFGDRRHARSVLERFGSQVAVREPDWLREGLIERARAVLAQYM
ncbi:helix-turn-helix transcriptional regulator [Cellulomonas denverensis]|uniref:WYL domain-containing protein n=1 Tax=Cellulomonas denverensis TaxID=264297 RepID=A0A7X6KTE1_9CELL|nr:WYL domain-containing protein [Cellulomonas denverensis]NKY21619.1 WYL domain-containing protein [Cellulomonas denverensis]GIG25510.1 transcriptional regulator [Cellulomonas denverensis]